MPDSRLNGAERGLQQSFRISLFFNGLLMLSAVAATYMPIRALPDLRALPPATSGVLYRPVTLTPATANSLHLVGAWEIRVGDQRFGGVSALALDGGRFLAVSDRGAVARFDLPSTRKPQAWLADLREGPGKWGKKWTRDAESLVRDPDGRGWWVGYEQRHSLYLYDHAFRRVLAGIDLRRQRWPSNRGAEGLLAQNGQLLVIAENGRKAMRVDESALKEVAIAAGADVAEAARAPDGSAWLLLRSKGLGGIRQSIAPLIRTEGGYRAGMAMPVPKGAFDNYEGMAIEERAGGGLRFWLLTDDGHRVMARNLLTALDYDPPGHDKSPARGTGLSRKPNGKP